MPLAKLNARTYRHDVHALSTHFSITRRTTLPYS